MGRDKEKREKDKKREKGKKDKVKKDKHGKDKGKRDNGRRNSRGRRHSPSADYDDDYSDYYDDYSYSESRSPTPKDRRRGGRGDDRGGRGRPAERRSRSRRRGYSPPPRGGGKGKGKDRDGGGGFIPTDGPRSPSRDGSPSNDWIFNMLIDREKARMKKDFAGADRIRDDMRLKGVDILERERRWQAKDGRSGARPNASDKKRGNAGSDDD
jgi:hypothetical protein